MKTYDTCSNKSGTADQSYPPTPFKRAFWAFLLLILPFVLAKVESVAGDESPFFREDFKDGDATDGAPVTWEINPLYGAEASGEVIDGSYILTTNGRSTVWTDESAPIGDVSIRVLLRGLSSEPHSILIVSHGNSDGSSYMASINDHGLTLSMATSSNPFPKFITGLIDGSFNPFTQDMNIQFDSEGKELSITAWPLESPKPSKPQLTGTAPIALKAGRVGINTQTHQIAIRSFEAIQIGGSPAPTLTWKSVGQNKLQFNIPQGYVLQNRPRLASPQWTDIEGSGTIELSTSEEAAFFQLRSQ